MLKSERDTFQIRQDEAQHHMKRSPTKKQLKQASEEKRRKKTQLVNELKNEQYRFYLQNQKNLKDQNSLTTVNTQKEQLMESSYGDSSGGCCFGIFGGSKRRDSNATENTDNKRRDTRKSESKKNGQAHSTASQGRSLINSDEWLKYLQNNLNNLKGLRWADNINEYIRLNNIDFKPTKYRSQIYFLNYTKHQISSSPIKKLYSHKLDDTSKVMSSSDISQSRIRFFDYERMSITSGRSSHELETTPDDELSDIYEVDENREVRLSTEQKTEKYLYDIQQPKKRDINLTVLENMDPQTQHLFEIIKQQLLDEEHPVNKICARFSYHFSRHYRNQIIQDDRSKEYYLIKELSQDKFELVYMSDSQRRRIEENFENLVTDEDDDDIYEDEDDDVLFDQGNKTSINGSFRKTIKRPTFAKQRFIFKNENEVHYKTSMEVLIEVKQFLCLIYGSVIRFYNTVLKLEVLEQMREDLIESLTNIVFNQRMAMLIMALCRICSSEDEQILALKVQELQAMKPSQLGLNQYFTLDQTSKIMDIYQQQYEPQQDTGDMGGSNIGFARLSDALEFDEQPTNSFENNKENKNFEAIEEQDDEYEEEEKSPMKRPETRSVKFSITSRVNQIDESYQDYGDEISNSDRELSFFDQNRKTIAAQKSLRLFKEIELRLKQKPYLLAIMELKNISSIVGPLEKVRCILQVSTLIVKSINQFWNDLKINKDKLTIDGDSLLMIYIYIAVKAKISDIFAQVKYMNEFSTPYVRTTKLGYCLTTLEIALNHINSLTKEDLVTDQRDQFSEINHWTDAKRTLTKSFRESVSLNSRPMSLLINEDPFENYGKQLLH